MTIIKHRNTNNYNLSSERGQSVNIVERYQTLTRLQARSASTCNAPLSKLYKIHGRVAKGTTYKHYVLKSVC